MLSTHHNKFLAAEPKNFEASALNLFRIQAKENPIYSQYLKYIGVNPKKVQSINSIPYLPIGFFRTHSVATGSFTPEAVFTSSGTTGQGNSRHLVASLSTYRSSFMAAFRLFYGEPNHYCILAILPSYLERSGSSLVYMVRELIASSGNPNSGFYLNATTNLISTLEELEATAQQTILIGVTFALLELVAKHSLTLKHTIVMETGGMKGRGKELTREELHSTLCKGFGVTSIHSEYGMTELLSQAYSQADGLFRCPPWMAIAIRDPYDPFTPLLNGRTGGINIIDLANTHSCAFIQTDDLGVTYPDGSFRVLGRLDGSQIRGCNLMVGG